MDAREFDMLLLEAEGAFQEMLDEFEAEWEGERAGWQQTNTSLKEATPGIALPTNLEPTQTNLPMPTAGSYPQLPEQ